MSQQIGEAGRIKLEKVTDADLELIEEIYFSTRKDEFAILGWNDDQLKMFLKMQCDFQQKSYSMEFPEADYSIIYADEIKVGRLIVNREKDEIRLVDIALLPEFRNNGIGSEIIKNLLDEADKLKKNVTLHVLKVNLPAFRLYRKLAFEVTGENDIYFSMEKKYKPEGV